MVTDLKRLGWVGRRRLFDFFLLQWAVSLMLALLCRELIEELGTVASRVNYGQVTLNNILKIHSRIFFIPHCFSFLPHSMGLLVQWDLLGLMATCGRLKEATLGEKITSANPYQGVNSKAILIPWAEYLSPKISICLSPNLSLIKKRALIIIL